MDIFPGRLIDSVNGQVGKVQVQEDRNVLFIQTTPSDIWTINHNMGKYPNITILDSAKNKVIGEEEHVDENTVILRFIGAFSGKATLN